MKKQKNWIWKLDERILELLYPPRFPFCDKLVEEKAGICLKCRKQIRYVTEPVCKKCGKPIENEYREYCWDCEKQMHGFVQGKAVWVYEGRVKASIYRFKYQNRRVYARVYAKEIAKRYGDWICRNSIQAIVPVPLHAKRKRWRGYNQAEILARELGACLGIPVYANCIKRIRNTKPQKEMVGTERKNNMKNAFKYSENVVKLKYVLIIDDIYTTGNTLDAVAEALYAGGVQRVYTCCISIGQGC